MTAPLNLFGLPPGVDFARALVDGIEARLVTAPPEAWARLTLIVNSGRMARRVTEELSRGAPRLLPRLVPVADIARLAPSLPAPDPLTLRLDIATFLTRLIDRQPNLAPKSDIFSLAGSLAALLEEMEGEGLTPDAFDRLDLGEHAAHWQRSRSILGAALGYLTAGEGAPATAEGRRARAVDALIAQWAAAPPTDPVIIAGSTGSRGTTRRLMMAVARLPIGAVVLPGFDADMPETHWHALSDALTGEDHPQFRFHALLNALDAEIGSIRAWRPDAAPPAPARNRLISLALCPAPVTDRWISEGASLPSLGEATRQMTLVHAPTPRAEAQAIALRLRLALAQGRRAALVTPDRELGRQVTTALARWGIVPDDSAGVPLHQTAPGRFLRMIAELGCGNLQLAALVALLKHPLASSGSDRGTHLRAVREFELLVRRKPLGRDAAHALAECAEGTPEHGGWATWLTNWLNDVAASPPTTPLTDRVARHLELTERLAAGPGSSGAGALWLEAAGDAARAAMDALRVAAPAYTETMSGADFVALLFAHLARDSVQDPRLSHPDIAILGALEARGLSSDTVILGGLNEGVWPGTPAPDPWLNRRMRYDAGLLLPERQIGLAAHDFQQAVAADEVILTRALRDAEAETVPSRWLNRLTNLLKGLGDAGNQALEEMEARGTSILAMAAALDRPHEAVPSEPRPSPCPPVADRPNSLSVTQISKLIRDPYSIYAAKILDLQRLAPLGEPPDARAKGIALHNTMEAFLADRNAWHGDPAAAHHALSTAAWRVLSTTATDLAIARLWHARLMAAADRIVSGEIDRLVEGTPVLVEERGALPLATSGFRLTAKPDRIDRLSDGTYAVWDYKSGSIPTAREVAAFDKQLPLEAAMVEAGSFPGLGSGPVSRLGYIALSPSGKDRDEGVLDKDGAKAADVERADLERLIAAYSDPSQGYSARRAVKSRDDPSDYDHLSRRGEWDMSDDPVQFPVGGPE